MAQCIACPLSYSSQAQQWKHIIPIDPTIFNPHISFTFRRLIAESEVQKQPPPPPICHPDKYVRAVPLQSPSKGTHSGLLYLTDPILSDTQAEFIVL